MYSRYIPNARGGFDRRTVPDPPTAPDPVPPPAAPDLPRQPPGDGGRAPPRPNSLPPRPNPLPPRPNPAPPRPGPGWGPPGPPPGLPGLDGLLGRLLPRGLDAEDLLVLAVLLLAMRQDGAPGTELLLAAAIYIWFP